MEIAFSRTLKNALIFDVPVEKCYLALSKGSEYIPYKYIFVAILYFTDLFLNDQHLLLYLGY